MECNRCTTVAEKTRCGKGLYLLGESDLAYPFTWKELCWVYFYINELRMILIVLHEEDDALTLIRIEQYINERNGFVRICE